MSLDNYKLSLSNAEHQVLIAKDGNMMCALLGNNLQDGYCGFGITVSAALHDLANDIEKHGL